MERFDGKRYLVTGASSGLGRAVCLALAARGASVILTGRNEDRLNATLQDMAHGDHRAMPCDLSQPEAVDSWLKDVSETFGCVDGLAYCAAICPLLRLKNSTPAILESVMQTNFLSFIACVRALSLGKPRARPMRIVAASSVAVTTISKYLAIYAASKAAVETAIRQLSTELVSRNVGICSIRLGYMDTPMNHGLEERTGDLATHIKKNGFQPMGLMPPEAAAEIILFLLSDKAHYITGASVPINGGAFAD